MMSSVSFLTVFTFSTIVLETQLSQCRLATEPYFPNWFYPSGVEIPPWYLLTLILEILHLILNFFSMKLQSS